MIISYCSSKFGVCGRDNGNGVRGIRVVVVVEKFGTLGIIFRKIRKVINKLFV